MEFVCTKCGHRENVATRKSKCDCGGLWKLDYVPPKYSAELIDDSVWGLFRYRRFMPGMSITVKIMADRRKHCCPCVEQA